MQNFTNLPSMPVIALCAKRIFIRKPIYRCYRILQVYTFGRLNTRLVKTVASNTVSIRYNSSVKAHRTQNELFGESAFIALASRSMKERIRYLCGEERH